MFLVDQLLCEVPCKESCHLSRILLGQLCSIDALTLDPNLTLQWLMHMLVIALPTVKTFPKALRGRAHCHSFLVQQSCFGIWHLPDTA